MNINKNSWHYKVYHWTYELFDNEWKIDYSSFTTNLCQYMRRLLIIAPLMALIIGILISIGGPLCLAFYAITIIPFFIIGYAPANPFNNNWDFYKSYNGFNIGSFRFKSWYPTVVIIPAGFLFAIFYGNYAWVHHYGWKWPLIVNGSIIGIILFCLLYIWFSDLENSKNETLRLLKANIAAKKQSICPIISFNDDMTNENK